MPLFKVTPVVIDNAEKVSYTEKALDIIGRPINKLTQDIIHSMKHQISLERKARRDTTYTQDEYTALCILDNYDIQCESAFENARESSKLHLILAGVLLIQILVLLGFIVVQQYMMRLSLLSQIIMVGMQL